ncbi:hypothetical protein EMH_0004510 [Eimeria mitis]|uniref:Uncharacterized protein n=1 Tax=Eimeria mitis TaxID=44415 RepID=U6K054_9EIME|nr:hypothetical protein EMH_0004510 [Eimeria mitis]
MVFNGVLNCGEYHGQLQMLSTATGNEQLSDVKFAFACICVWVCLFTIGHAVDARFVRNPVHWEADRDRIHPPRSLAWGCNPVKRREARRTHPVLALLHVVAGLAQRKVAESAGVSSTLILLLLAEAFQDDGAALKAPIVSCCRKRDRLLLAHDGLFCAPPVGGVDLFGRARDMDLDLDRLPWAEAAQT